MKKYIYILIALVTGLCLATSSCDDFLEEDTSELITVDSFFNNEEEANLALNGIQGQMPNGTSMGDFLGTDLGVYGRSVASASMKPGIYNYDADNSVVANDWTVAYAGIKDCNYLLSGIVESSLSDEVIGNTYAQALFYRAIFYWDLTTRFGDVPYWRDELDMDYVSLLGKTDASEIQEDMITDLELAISAGYMSTDKWNDNDSRPTIWAARMLKAYYHMWLGQWSEAQAELSEVTLNSPHTLSDDYADIYREGNERHDEIIFGMENLSTAAKAYSNNSHNNAHYNSSGENASTRTVMEDLDIWQSTAGMTYLKSFADTFDDQDERKLYNVWDSYTDEEGTTVNFNWIYMPKLMRACTPLEDPLMETADISGYSSETYKIFRLSEAYLCLSEAEFMIDSTSTQASLDAINVVRVRAGLSELTTMTHEDIRNERAWELAGEGFSGRKKDLIRWGMLESTVLATPDAETAAGGYSKAITRAQEAADIISAAVTGKYRVYPIPNDELEISAQIGGALEQNPLWE
jgi:hypothetical protein